MKDSMLHVGWWGQWLACDRHAVDPEQWINCLTLFRSHRSSGNPRTPVSLCECSRNNCRLMAVRKATNKFLQDQSQWLAFGASSRLILLKKRNLSGLPSRCSVTLGAREPGQIFFPCTCSCRPGLWPVCRYHMVDPHSELRSAIWPAKPLCGNCSTMWLQRHAGQLFLF